MEGSLHKILVYSDHKNLTYFHNARVLTRWQARWAQFLTRFEFKILYRPGSQQGKADVLSRRTYLAPCPGEATFDDQKQILLGPAQLQAVEVSHMPIDSNILNSIRQDLQIDVFAQEVLVTLIRITLLVLRHNILM